MFDTISFCIGEKTIEINGAPFSLGELTTQVLNIPKDEYQAMLELATTAFETMYKNKKNVLDNINNLPSENIEEIEKITNKITNEKSQFVLKKLSYLLLRYLGYSNKQASKMYGISTVTGNNWFKTWQNEGYEALKRKPGQGRKKKLNDENLLDLKKTRKKR